MEMYHGIDGILVGHTEAASIPEPGAGPRAGLDLDPNLNQRLNPPQLLILSQYHDHQPSATTDGPLQVRDNSVAPRESDISNRNVQSVRVRDRVGARELCKRGVQGAMSDARCPMRRVDGEVPGRWNRHGST